jgi:hypothetical protein
MMIKSKKETGRGPIEIDLTGPEGNAFYILGVAKKLGYKLGMPAGVINTILSDMRSSTYDHLIEVFEKHFGDHVIMYK